MQAQLWSVNGLAVELGVDRRALAKRLEGLTPDHIKTQGTREFRSYLLRNVWAHLSRGDQPAGGESDPGEILILDEQRARLAKEQADKHQMDNAVRRGELAPIEWFEEQLAAYTRPLAAFLDSLPIRMRQLLPHLTQIDHARIERFIADERSAVADRLASGIDPGEAGAGEGGEPAESAAAAAAERVG